MSRYPAMSQAPLPYDRSLLAAAPSLTRQDRQAGYDVNALEQGTYTQPGPINTRTMGQDQPAASDPFGDQYGERTHSPTSTTGDQRPWWKRKRWAALALIIFIGIICGIIAGVVTARNSRNTTNLISSPEGQNQDSNTIASVPSSSSSPPAVGATPTRTTATPVMTSDPRGANNGNTGNVGSGNGNGGVSVVIGRPTPTLPPGVILPTATGQPAPNDPFDDPGFDEIPLICYVTPTSRQCAPYFEDDPPRLF